MKVALVGDIGLFGDFCLSNNPKLKDYFKDVKQIFDEHDIVIGNLETPFVDKVVPYGAKSAHIYSHPENIEVLKYLGFDYVNLSNNHIYDFGQKSYDLTKDVLKGAGIDYFGVESKQIRTEKKGSRIALHGYCSYNTNPQKMTFDKSEGINALDVDVVKSNMMENYRDGYLNIVSIHSGQEHVHYPSRDDISFARELGDQFSYVYYGHHPHVIQGIESYCDALISYSLGNFCFSDVYTAKSDKPLVKQSQSNKSGLILSLTLEDSKVSEYRAIPVFMGSQAMEVGSQAILEQLQDYNAALEMDSETYEKMRADLIQRFIGGRKELRDLKWYLKRLNFNSVRVLMNARNNSKRYNLHFKSKLS